MKKGFFFSLADYVKHLKATPELKKIIQKITKEKEELLKEWDEYEAQALKELENAKQKLLKIVKQNKIASPELNEAIEKLNCYEAGKMLSSGVKSDNIEYHLWDIAKAVFQTKHKELLKEFIEEKPTVPNINLNNRNFVFSKTIPKRRQLEKRIIEFRKTELWGCWDYLNLVPIILLEKKKFHEVVSKRDLGLSEIFVEQRHIFKTRNSIQNEMYNPLPLQIPPEEAREMMKYKLYASRIHNLLLKELDLETGTKVEPVQIFTNEVVPDRTAEIQKQMDEARIRASEQAERERQHREQLKQDRILRTLIDKYAHALDLIIERTEFAEDGNDFSIEFYDFNFEKMIGSRMLEKFLTEMQKFGCFEGYKRTNYTGGTRFGFVKPNAKKTEIIGWDESKNAFRMAVAAVPDKNKANLELIKFLSKLLKAKISIVKGSKSREKTLEFRQL